MNSLVYTLPGGKACEPNSSVLIECLIAKLGIRVSGFGDANREVGCLLEAEVIPLSFDNKCEPPEMRILT